MGEGGGDGCLNSNELNYLVFRYLQESGLTHAAFALGYEAGIDKSPIDGHMVPPGTLVKIVQKGLQYIEMEANVDIDPDDDFTLVDSLELITMDVPDLRKIIGERRENQKKENLKKENPQKKKDREKERDKIHVDEYETLHKQERDVEMEECEKEQPNKEKDREKKQEQHRQVELNKHHENKIKTKFEENGVSGGPQPMEIANELIESLDCEIRSSDVTILKGHTSEVFACAWSPIGSILASGSGDSTARLWCLPQGPNAPSMQTGIDVCVLKHFKGRTNDKSKEVTTLDWNGDGTLLATGSYDGNARIWGRDGELKNTLNKHKGPIFSLKWNKKQDYLLSGSVDRTAIVWDTKTWECKQQFEFHSAPTLDVDWRNDVSFASGSTDHMIYVCKIGENRPIKAFSGHQGEVNAIKWDPTGSLLASCSDDRTAKIWSLKYDNCVHNLTDHEKEIYTIKWSPTGPDTCNPNQKLILASASFDSIIKLWDAELGKLLYNLHGHKQPVYSVAFSPNGEYLASGSLDQSLHIWSTREGKVVKTYRGTGGIFEVCWNREGDKIAACFSNNTVCVAEFRM
ncbi:transducin family protein / WD-40 repeat family protein [Zostera marina]|uniref:Transducin family protein / WD-40 repeat family protein n=1 Tax=Zostera marina TaxID=29655 RepID=A0A0K9NVB9_ZOSMR|nr:transducin family protein / WD-40 repeat family protein [Zostera marina]